MSKENEGSLHMKLTEEVLKQLEEAEQKATAVYPIPGISNGAFDAEAYTFDKVGLLAKFYHVNDASFYALARNHMRSLLAELRQLMAESAELKAELFSAEKENDAIYGDLQSQLAIAEQERSASQAKLALATEALEHYADVYHYGVYLPNHGEKARTALSKIRGEK